MNDIPDSPRLWPMRVALALAFAAAAALATTAWYAVSWLPGSPGSSALARVLLVAGLVVAIGGVVALVTAYRRQRLEEVASVRAERIHALANHDYTERRATELYGQAILQLGHDRAAVRVGGLYSLERLAHDHPQHRQIVVNIVCAYLRMPYELPDAHGSGEIEQELQVRLTAQRMLARHLALPSAQDAADQSSPVLQAHWDAIRIDLTGAHLVTFDFSYCRPEHADFRYARFSGETRFIGTEFSGRSCFEQATFGRDAWFSGAAFSGDAQFTGAVFRGVARFDGTAFNRDAQFNAAEFHGVARFDGAAFSREAQFSQTAFGQDTWFDKTAFRGTAVFGETSFTNRVDFTNATASYPNERHLWPHLWDARPLSAGAKTAQLVKAE